MTLEQIQAAAIAENLKNPDGSEITTEEQLIAARALAQSGSGTDEETDEQKAAREAKELEEAALNDPLTRAMLEGVKTSEEIEKVEDQNEKMIQAAPDTSAERAKNLATLVEWGVKMADDATDEQIAAKVAEGKPAPAAPPTEKNKRRKFSVVKKESIEGISPEPVVSTASSSPIHQAAPPTASDEEYIKTLTDEQRDELYEAEVAEMLEPAKMKGQKQKLLDYFKRFDREAQEITAAEPDVKLEESDRFKALARAKPTLDQHIVKKVNREIGARDGERRAEQKLSPKVQQMEMTTRRIEMAPKVQKFISTEFSPAIDKVIELRAAPESSLGQAVKIIKEKGVEAAESEGYKLECKIYKEEKARMESVAESFFMLKDGAVAYNPKNPAHAFLIGDGADEGFIAREGRSVVEYEAKHGRIDKSRKFLPRAEFAAMLGANKSEASTFNAREWNTKNFCTFKDHQLLDAFATHAEMSMQHRINIAHKNAEEVGFERRPSSKNTPATNKKTPPVEIAPPKASPSAARGASKPQEKSAAPSQVIDVIATNYPHLKAGRV